MKITLKTYLARVPHVATKPPGRAYGVALAILGVAAVAGGCLLLHRYYRKKAFASASQPGADIAFGGPASDSPITAQSASTSTDLEGKDFSLAKLSDQELALKYAPGNEYEDEVFKRANIYSSEDGIKFFKICDKEGNFVGMRALPGNEWAVHVGTPAMNKGYVDWSFNDPCEGVDTVNTEDPQTYLLLVDLHFNESGSFDHFTVEQLIDLFWFNEEKLQNEIDRIHILQLLNNRDISGLLNVDLVAKLYIANQLYGPFNHLFTQLIKFFKDHPLEPFLEKTGIAWGDYPILHMINHLDGQRIHMPEIKDACINYINGLLNEGYLLSIGRLKDHGTRNKISKLQVNGANRGEHPELLDTELAEQYAPNNEYENELNCRTQREYQPGMGVNKFFKIRNSKGEFVAMRAFQCPIDKKHSFGGHQGLKCHGNGKLIAYFQESPSLQDKYPDIAAYVRCPLVEIRADDPEATLAALDFILGDAPLEDTDPSLALRMFLIASKDWGAPLQMIEIINYLNNCDLSSILTPDSARQLHEEIKSYLQIGNIDHLLHEITKIISPE